MGFWISVAVGMFLLGTFMALKPDARLQRLDMLRMQARRQGLQPKLVPYPDWLPPITPQPTLIAEYGLVIPDMTLPELRLQISPTDITLHSSDYSQLTSEQLTQIHHLLNQQPQAIRDALPEQLIPHSLGVYTKANFIAIYWQEVWQVHPSKLDDAITQLPLALTSIAYALQAHISGSNSVT